MATMPELGPEEIPRVVLRALKRSRPLGRLAQLLGLSILRGDLKPGEAVLLEALPTCDIVASRTQLREAIKVLEGKGLIESKPRSGTRVRARENWNLCDPEVLSWRIATGSVDEILSDFHQLRRGIEPQAAALAATHGDERQRAALSTAYEAMMAADLTSLPRDGLVDAGVGFHQALLTASGNDFFASLARVLEPPLVLSLGLSIAIHPNPEDYLGLCERLCRAVLAGNADAARGRALDLLVDADEVSMRFLERSTAVGMMLANGRVAPIAS